MMVAQATILQTPLLMPFAHMADAQWARTKATPIARAASAPYKES